MKKSNHISFAIILFLALTVLMSSLTGCRTDTGASTPDTQTAKPDNPDTTDITSDVTTDVTADTAADRTTYTIIIANGIEHGTVTADMTADIAPDTTIILTVRPDKGYKTKSIAITDSDGAMIRLTDDYCFTMPHADMTVTANFEAMSYTVTFISSGGTAVEQQTVKSGETAQVPTEPEKWPYLFTGWYTSNDNGQTLSDTPFDFATPITGNTVLYAKWSPVYIVLHLRQNADNDDYTVVYTDIEWFPCKAGEQTKAKAKSYEGFEVQPFEQQTIAADDLTDDITIVQIKYNRKTVTLTFSSNGEEWSDGTTADKIISGRYGARVESAPAIPIKNGYGSRWDKDIQGMFTSDETYTAQYISGMVNYTVKHSLEFADGAEYYSIEDVYCGKAGNKTSAEPKDYEYCIIQPFKQQTIKGDGSTVVEIFYKREIVTLNFDTDGGSRVKPISGRYLDEYTTPDDPTKPGYTFAGWDPALPVYEYDDESGDHHSMNVLIRMTAKALWTPNTDTKFTVRHLQQPASLSEDLSDYTPVAADTENMTGTTGETTAVSAKDYPGFTALPITQQTIAGNGSTVVNVYYNRKSYTATFNANGGDGSMEVQTFYYGVSQKLPPSRFTKFESFFSGWALTSEGSKACDNESSYKIGAADVTLYAVWTPMFRANRRDSAIGDIVVTNDNETTLRYVPSGLWKPSAYTGYTAIGVCASADKDCMIKTLGEMLSWNEANEKYGTAYNTSTWSIPTYEFLESLKSSLGTLKKGLTTAGFPTIYDGYKDYYLSKTRNWLASLEYQLNPKNKYRTNWLVYNNGFGNIAEDVKTHIILVRALPD